MSSDEKPTVELEKPPAWAVSLAEKMSAGFQTVNARLSSLETNLDLQGDTVRDVGKRITSLEERVGKVEDRQQTNSERVRGESSVNLEQNAAIGTLVADVAALKDVQSSQLAILQRLDAVAANPMVRRIAYAVGALLLSYLTAKGWLAK